MNALKQSAAESWNDPFAPVAYKHPQVFDNYIGLSPTYKI